MRVLIVIVSLVVVLPLASLAWLSSQVTAQSILDGISEAMKEEGLQMSHDNQSSLGIFPNAFLEVSQISVIIPASDQAPEVSIDLSGLRFDASLFSLLSSPRGNLSVRGLKVDSIDLSNLTSAVVIEDTVTLPNLSAELWKGALNGKVVIDSGSDNVVIRTEGVLENADASDVFMSLADMDLLTGTLSLNWNLEIIPPESDNGIAELTGKLNVSSETMTLESIDLEGSICSTVALAEGRRPSSPLSGNTIFTRFDASQTLAGTEITIDELTLVTSAMTLNGKGVLDRASTAFTAEAVASLDAKSMNQRSDCRISSSIANIQWPVRCKGRTDAGNARSWCQVDVSSIVEQTLKGRIKDKLKLDDDSNLIQSLLKRIR